MKGLITSLLLAVALLTPGLLHAQGVKTPAGKAETEDSAAIKKAVASFVESFEKRDAKAVAAHWTENGEYLTDDGATFRGRDAIEKEYTRLFSDKKAPKVKVEVEIESLRFPSRDTAIEEGYFKVRSEKDAPTASKYTVLHVREGGKWLMAVVREWPNTGANIRELEWLIGSWSAKKDDIQIQATYEWWGEKTFIKATLSLKGKKHTFTGFQLIGKDSSTGHLRSWAFDPDGSFGEATWARDGKKWMQDSSAVLVDGKILTSTNIITRLDDDSFTFQSVQRSQSGEDLPDVPPVRVARVKTGE